MEWLESIGFDYNVIIICIGVIVVLENVIFFFFNFLWILVWDLFLVVVFGNYLLIMGLSGSGKSFFFWAIVGLWDSG